MRGTFAVTNGVGTREDLNTKKELEASSRIIWYLSSEFMSDSGDEARNRERRVCCSLHEGSTGAGNFWKSAARFCAA